MSHLDRAVRALRSQCAVYPWVVRVDVDDSSGYEVIVVYVKQVRDLRREIVRHDPLGYRLETRVEVVDDGG